MSLLVRSIHTRPVYVAAGLLRVRHPAFVPDG